MKGGEVNGMGGWENEGRWRVYWPQMAKILDSIVLHTVLFGLQSSSCFYCLTCRYCVSHVRVYQQLCVSLLPAEI